MPYLTKMRMRANCDRAILTDLTGLGVIVGLISS
jgi:hypothetical protein